MQTLERIGSAAGRKKWSPNNIGRLYASPQRKNNLMGAIQLKAVTKIFGSLRAVDRASFHVAEGDFVSILGPSGCGKTTLLRMIAGFETPNEGEILIGGVPIAHLPPWKRNIGVVFQSYALFPYLTVFDNVAFGLRMRKTSRSDMASQIEKVLEIVGLAGLHDRYPRQLSGGQAQRVALARAIVYKPEVLLLDEPLSNLDARLRDEMRFELIRIQNETGVTTLFVTHDQSEALAISDSIVVMNNSVVCQVGPPEEIWAHPSSVFVADFVGVENIFRGKIAEENGSAKFQFDVADEYALAFSKPKYEKKGVCAAGIRGRDVCIVDGEAEGHLTIPGKVLGASYQGHERVYEIDTPLSNRPITAVIEASQIISDTVKVAFPYNKFLWLKDE